MITNPIPFRTEQERPAALRIPKPIDLVQLQTTVSTVFTARTDADFQIEALIASNVTATADYVTVYLVASGDTADATNLAIYQKAIPAKDWVAIYTKDLMGFLQPGMSLQALCGVNDAVNIYGYGFDYQGAYG